MRIPRIYQATEMSPGMRIELDRLAAHHLTRVLRLRQDEALLLFNGEGGEYHASLHIEGKHVYANISKFIDNDRDSCLDITLLQGISKGDRMDISIQKAVELGVGKIIPVICQRTVVNLKQDRREKKHQHWQGIIVNACEQSGRNRLPVLDFPVKLDQALVKDLPGTKFTLDPESSTCLHEHKPESNKVVLLIGPEGGLTNEEIEHARDHGYRGIRMGPRILRTETAALAGIAALQTLWGDFSNPLRS